MRISSARLVSEWGPKATSGIHKNVWVKRGFFLPLFSNCLDFALSPVPLGRAVTWFSSIALISSRAHSIRSLPSYGEIKYSKSKKKNISAAVWKWEGERRMMDGPVLTWRYSEQLPHCRLFGAPTRFATCPLCMLRPWTEASDLPCKRPRRWPLLRRQVETRLMSGFNVCEAQTLSFVWRVADFAAKMMWPFAPVAQELQNGPCFLNCKKGRFVMSL